ncbi:MAG: class I SAM-dependent methyltransferase [candidate division WOR-3 bacterium]
MQNLEIKEVKSFWNQNICGKQFIKNRFGTREFFEEYSRFRYTTEWHLNEFVSFDRYKEKKVLEVGCGMGADGRRFAENGAIYTGIDLTESAVNATKNHFQLFNLNGEFKIENVEEMDFADKSFDMVYAHGVLHHTPDIKKAINEIYRVLKPDGEIIIMLYHKNSLNYYFRIMIVLRMIVLIYIIFRPILTKKLKKRWLEEHYQNFIKIGKNYFRPSEFLNHATDGVECPIARAYTKDDVKKLFDQFGDLKFRVAHLPLRKYTKLAPFWFERLLAKRFGWYLFVYGKK